MSKKRTKVSSEKKGTSKNKKKTAVAIVLVLVVGIIGGTLAYLSTLSDDATNVFLGSGDISLRLIEPDWVSTQTGRLESERARASDYTPEGQYLKNPMLFNTTSAVTGTNAEATNNKYTEWVAIRVDFKMEKNNNASTNTYGWNKKTQEQKKAPDNIDKAKWSDLCNLMTIKWCTNRDATTKNYSPGFDENWVLLCKESDLDSNSKLPFKDYSFPTNNSIASSDTSSWAVFMYKKAVTPNAITDTTMNTLHTTVETFNTEDDYAAVASEKGKAITTPLFDMVEIQNQDTLKTNGFKTGTSDTDAKIYLPYFDIKVSGAAIKNESTYSNSGTIERAMTTDTLQTNATEMRSVVKALLGLYDVECDENASAPAVTEEETP